MALNEEAVAELLGELVFTHTFRSADAKEHAVELLHRVKEPVPDVPEPSSVKPDEKE